MFCGKKKVTKMCKNCRKNFYCNKCYNEFHSRGARRNHKFYNLKVQQDLGKDFKVDKYSDGNNTSSEVDDEQDIGVKAWFTKMKRVFDEKNLDLFEFLSTFDFEGFGVIEYKILNQALSRKTFIKEEDLERMLKIARKDYWADN